MSHINRDDNSNEPHDSSLHSFILVYIFVDLEFLFLFQIICLLISLQHFFSFLWQLLTRTQKMQVNHRGFICMKTVTSLEFFVLIGSRFQNSICTNVPVVSTLVYTSTICTDRQYTGTSFVLDRCQDLFFKPCIGFYFFLEFATFFWDLVLVSFEMFFSVTV